jgi:feruloyl esterase
MQKQRLSSPGAYIPASLLPMIDKAALASCDALDGLRDGLIQNPGRCTFKPAALLCNPDTTTDCLTREQVQDTHDVSLAGARCERPRAVPRHADQRSCRSARSDFVDHRRHHAGSGSAAHALGQRSNKTPIGWKYAHEVLANWLGLGPQATIDVFEVNPRTGVVGAAALRRFEQSFAGINTYDPSALSIRKMIMYHGFSAPAISPYRSVMFYEQFARLQGGYAKAKHSLRLFMVPGMHHCGSGPGPDSFDTLTALEAWAEHEAAPNGIIATATAPGATKRSMPLYMFPQQATYRGSGEVNTAVNWACTDNQALLEPAAP